jgi:hypothetical protein
VQIKNFKGWYQDPNLFIQLPLQLAVHQEIARYYLKQVRLIFTGKASN